MHVPQDIVSDCKHLICRDIEDLIKSNCDYLVDSLSSRLRQVDAHPTAPIVLSVMLSYSGSDLLPLIQDVIDEVSMVMVIVFIG